MSRHEIITTIKERGDADGTGAYQNNSTQSRKTRKNNSHGL